MYPILVKLEELSILVVGGGQIATRKVQGLIEAGGRPVVIAPKLTAEIAKLAAAEKVVWQQRGFVVGDTEGFQMVFACTDQPKINQQIAGEIKTGQLFNDTTQKERGNFYNMVMVTEDGIGLAATTFGKDPRRSKGMKTILSEFIHKLTEMEK